MLYMCGLLFSEAKFIKSLCIEIPEPDRSDVGHERHCPSWETTGRAGIAERLDFEKSPSPDSPIKYLKFLLRPLELPGRVKQFSFLVSDDFKRYITPDLQRTFDRYTEALTDQKPFTYDETEWLWDEYMAIQDRKQLIQRERREARKEEHHAWLIRQHQWRQCMHLRTKRYYRMGPRNANCDGCHNWLPWLLDCKKCELRACKNCITELKGKREELEEEIHQMQEERKRLEEEREELEEKRKEMEEQRKEMEEEELYFGVAALFEAPQIAKSGYQPPGALSRRPAHVCWPLISLHLPPNYADSAPDLLGIRVIIERKITSKEYPRMVVELLLGYMACYSQHSGGLVDRGN
ncbi:MAG: hypothetical protein Q9168_003687 [Polycauliona sp. 1 TL-2023]